VLQKLIKLVITLYPSDINWIKLIYEFRYQTRYVASKVLAREYDSVRPDPMAYITGHHYNID